MSKDTFTATEATLRQNIRRIKSQQIAHFMMHELRDFIPDDCYQKAADRLYKLLHDAGAEIVTDQTRAEYGLPARGPDGWTMEELHALELRKLELLTKPFIIPALSDDKEA